MTENDIAAVIVDAALKSIRHLDRACWNLSTRQRLSSNCEDAA